jgi:hypothetical protein
LVMRRRAETFWCSRTPWRGTGAVAEQRYPGILYVLQIYIHRRRDYGIDSPLPVRDNQSLVAIMIQVYRLPEAAGGNFRSVSTAP